MSWDEYKRLGPHSGSYSLRDIGVGVILGLGIGGGIGLGFSFAAPWLAVMGAAMGGAVGTLPSILRNQVRAYEDYLRRHERYIEDHPDINAASPMPEGTHVARLMKEQPIATARSLK